MIRAHPNVEYIGEIAEHQKARFLGDALALLFPIGWPEPFGLVMIESLACGTPVIAFRSGSVPEVIDNGVSGFVVDGVEEAAKAVSGLSKIDRAAVRRAFENRFTVERMSRDYLKMYAGLPGVRRTNEIRTMNGAEIGFHLPI
jgi:glycosyltransferase involved in cell wall biosynthesis